jgi:hypothetical protein
MFERIIPKVCLWSGEDNTSLSIETVVEKNMGRNAGNYFADTIALDEACISTGFFSVAP